MAKVLNSSSVSARRAKAIALIKAGVVHSRVGKASFTESALQENIKALLDVISKARPAGVKGTYIKKLSLSSTMGPGLQFSVE